MKLHHSTVRVVFSFVSAANQRTRAVAGSLAAVCLWLGCALLQPLVSWLTSANASRRWSRPSASVRLQLEMLEGRIVPSYMIPITNNTGLPKSGYTVYVAGFAQYNFNGDPSNGNAGNYAQNAYYLGNLQNGSGPVIPSNGQYQDGLNLTQTTATQTQTVTAIPYTSLPGPNHTITLPDIPNEGSSMGSHDPTGRLYLFVVPNGTAAPTLNTNQALVPNQGGMGTHVVGLGLTGFTPGTSTPEPGFGPFYYEALEFTENPSSLDLDWTTVDQFEFPLTMSSTIGGTTVNLGVEIPPAGQTYQLGRGDILAQYGQFITQQDSSTSGYLSLPVTANGIEYGIASPLTVSQSGSDPLAGSFNTVLNTLFEGVSAPAGNMFFQGTGTNVFEAVADAANHRLDLYLFSGGVAAANPSYYVEDPRNYDTSQSADFQIFGAQGIFADATQVINNAGNPGTYQGNFGELLNQILTPLNAALNRGVAAEAGDYTSSPGTGMATSFWANQNNWYPAHVEQNFFAAFFHTALVNGLQLNYPNPGGPQTSAQGFTMGLSYGGFSQDEKGASCCPVNPQFGAASNIPTIPDGGTLTVTLDTWLEITMPASGNGNGNGSGTGGTPFVPTPPPVPSVAPVNAVFAVAADAGGGPQVNVYNALTGQLVNSFNAFAAGFTGGVRVAVGDVNGDGIPDLIVGAGPGGSPQISVYDGATHQLIRSFFALPQSFTGGVFVAAGDINGDGYADIVVSADRGGGPEVAIFDGKTGAEITAFYATASTFTGGIRIAVADVNGDGFGDVIAAAGPGGGPQVTVFDGKTMKLLTAFYAFTPSFTGGLWVAAGDINGDGLADIIVGADQGGGPQVTAFDGSGISASSTQAPKALANFFAFPSGFTGGVRVGIVETATGRDNILTGAGPGGAPEVAIFDGISQQMVNAFFALPSGFTGGVFVGGV